MPPPGASELQSFTEHQAALPEVRRAIIVDQITGTPLPVGKPLGLMDKLSLAKTGWQMFQIIRNHALSPSWKTSLFGASGLVTLVLDTAHNYSAGIPINWMAVAAAASVGVGLLYSKDASISTEEQQGFVAASR
jgi:hypothetical protein